MTQTILDLNSKNARKYFMNPYVYFPMRLPEYINFSNVLSEADKILTTKKYKRIPISDVEYGNNHAKLKNYDNVNYKFNISKSNKYS